MRRLFSLTLPLVAIAALAGVAQTSSASAQTATTACSQSSGGQAGQVACPVTASATLMPPQTVYVAPPGGSGTTVSCEGVTGNGYTVQATQATLPGGLNLYSYSAGQGGCSFQVTAGAVSPGAPLGVAVFSAPYFFTASSLQPISYVCGDPTCAAGVTALQPPPPPGLAAFPSLYACGASVVGPVSPFGCDEPESPVMILPQRGDRDNGDRDNGDHDNGGNRHHGDGDDNDGN